MENQIPVWSAALIISAAGAIGGIINSSLITLNIVKATRLLDINSQIHISLTFIINSVTGVTAALVAWSSYGPISNIGILEDMNRNLLTIPSVIGSILVGYSGASWLTTHADKQKWQDNTKKAIEKKENLNLSKEISNLGPDEASKKIDNAP